MVDFVNRNYYAVLMSENKKTVSAKPGLSWAQILHLNLLQMAKAARGFFDSLR